MARSMKPIYAAQIVKTLHEKGHEAYFVGGCVRDMVMEIEPADYDIATSALPEEVMMIFPRTEPIGARFGVILVIHYGVPFEVATFRSDQAYIDGRRPTSVVFTNAEEDVYRRDFTINGLLYDPVEQKVIDYVGGREDIASRTVRAIGNPAERFEEDKLRILRAIRFGARLGYSIEPETWNAVGRMAAKIHQVSAERIRQELVRILTEGEATRGVRMLAECGLLAEILPEISWSDYLERRLEMLDIGGVADFAMAVLLADASAEASAEVVARLKFSSREQDHIAALVREQGRFARIRDMSVAELKRFMRRERFTDYLELYRVRMVAADEPLDDHAFVCSKLEGWTAEDLKPEPLISGDDLITLGLQLGPSFKEILTAVENEQLEGRLVDQASAIVFVRERTGK